MNSEADESKLRKRMDDLHKDIDIMKGEKFRLTDIKYGLYQKRTFNPYFYGKAHKFFKFRQND
jgi:hypothetical protein